LEECLMWDPTVYRRFGSERSRPFADLVGRIGAEKPRAVVDLGCGPGDLTATLADRWPDARVTGLDSSPEMIERALALGAGVDFGVGDVRDWRPGPDTDVLVTNATLQWVPEHRELLDRWARELPAGAWLAMQVPGNFDAPSHRASREIAATAPFAAELAGSGPPWTPGRLRTCTCYPRPATSTRCCAGWRGPRCGPSRRSSTTRGTGRTRSRWPSG
jgi:trans-aconitate 2-methyltransferase